LTQCTLQIDRFSAWCYSRTKKNDGINFLYVRQLDPGAALFLNNVKLLHPRTVFIDWENLSKKSPAAADLA